MKTATDGQRGLRFCDRLILKMNRDAACRDPRQTATADKLQAKTMARRMGLAVPRTLAVIDDPARLDPDLLPPRCVVKPTHLAGEVCVFRDGWIWSTRPMPSRAEVSRHAHLWFGLNHALRHRMRAAHIENFGQPWIRYEWCYENIPPRILVEELLWHDALDWLPIELKFYCFHGRVRMIETTVDRYRSGQHAWMDPDWNRLPIARLGQANLKTPIPRPPHLSDTAAAAEVIARPFDFLRVDFLEIGGPVPFFGEITHYPAAGGIAFTPSDWNVRIGDWMA